MWWAAVWRLKTQFVSKFGSLVTGGGKLAGLAEVEHGQSLDYIAMINYLKKIRKSQKVTQVALAETIDWNHRDISKVESFVRRLDLIELCQWLDALEYDLGDFLRDIGQLK